VSYGKEKEESTSPAYCHAEPERTNTHDPEWCRHLDSPGSQEQGMTNHHKDPVPANWAKCQKEIDALLRFYYPDYEERVYLKPVYYLQDIIDHPEKYPLLAELSVKYQKRHISIFLKQHGRIPRSTTPGVERTWMLVGAA
jgi:hypothetical protein